MKSQNGGRSLPPGEKVDSLACCQCQMCQMKRLNSGRAVTPVHPARYTQFHKTQVCPPRFSQCSSSANMPHTLTVTDPVVKIDGAILGEGESTPRPVFGLTCQVASGYCFVPSNVL